MNNSIKKQDFIDLSESSDNFLNDVFESIKTNKVTLENTANKFLKNVFISVEDKNHEEEKKSFNPENNMFLKGGRNEWKEGINPRPVLQIKSPVKLDDSNKKPCKIYNLNEI